MAGAAFPAPGPEVESAPVVPDGGEGSVDPGQSSSEHLQRGRSWRVAAAELLGPITAKLVVAEGRSPAWSDLVMVDERRVRLAAQCQAMADGGEDEYLETAGKARRRVGLAVLAVLRERPGLDPVSAFEWVLTHRTQWLPDRLVEWVDQLGRGGQAALAQEAVGYASAVAAWVPPARMRDVSISAPSDWLTWTVPGRAMRIRGRCDAVTPRGARPADRRLLVVARTLDHAQEVAGHVALAYTLMLGSVPGRVTVLAPATGREAVAVDEHLLGRALERAGRAANAAVAARFGPSAPTTPGAWCRWCDRLDDCADGARFVAATPVRIGGLVPLGAT